MGLSYFWFVAAAIIGAMDLYFGNILLLVISERLLFRDSFILFAFGLLSSCDLYRYFLTGHDIHRGA